MRKPEAAVSNDSEDRLTLIEIRLSIANLTLIKSVSQVEIRSKNRNFLVIWEQKRPGCRKL